MNCGQIKALLIEQVEGDLCLELNDYIESHLRICKDCNAYRDILLEICIVAKEAGQKMKVNAQKKESLKEDLLSETRLFRASSPFLSALHRKKEEKHMRIAGKKHCKSG